MPDLLREAINPAENAKPITIIAAIIQMTTLTAFELRNSDNFFKFPP